MELAGLVKHYSVADERYQRSFNLETHLACFSSRVVVVIVFGSSAHTRQTAVQVSRFLLF
jgi:hypothetical protein